MNLSCLNQIMRNVNIITALFAKNINIQNSQFKTAHRTFLFVRSDLVICLSFANLSNSKYQFTHFILNSTRYLSFSDFLNEFLCIKPMF